jgi:hypothetical protein
VRPQSVEFETRSRKNEMPTSVFTHDCDCDALRIGWLARVQSHEDRKRIRARSPQNTIVMDITHGAAWVVRVTRVAKVIEHSEAGLTFECHTHAAEERQLRGADKASALGSQVKSNRAWWGGRRGEWPSPDRKVPATDNYQRSPPRPHNDAHDATGTHTGQPRRRRQTRQ